MRPTRRRYRSPDGLDWRDPNMPVVRDYRMADGSRKSIVEPDYEHRYREHLITAAVQPKHYDDPTYNMRKK